jgi:hypothetical protein
MREDVSEYVLLPGPGLAVRWVLAAPLLLLAIVVPALGSGALASWISVSFENDLFGGYATFWGEFREHLDNMRILMVLPAIVLLVFLVRRTVFATWPTACLWLALWAMVPSTLLVTVVNDGLFAQNIALSLGLVWLNYELGRLGSWVLSRPVARDLALSSLEIPYRPKGTRARLRVRHDRLLLDRLKADRGSRRKEIRWAALQEVRLEHVTAPRDWQASKYTKVEVPEGPALRIVADNDTWLLPVPEPLGEDLVAAITLRANGAH